MQLHQFRPGTLAIGSQQRISRSKVTLLNPVSNWYMRICQKLLEDLRWLISDKEYERLRKCSSIDEWSSVVSGWSLKKLENQGDLTVVEFAARRQLAAVVEKLNLPGDASKRVSAALARFHEAETLCEEWNARGPARLAASPYYSSIREFVERTVGPLLPRTEQLWYSARHGPGAVYGTETLKRYSAFCKFAEWPYSVTPRARKHAVDLIRSDARWWGALEASYRARHGIKPWQILNQRAFWDNILTDVPGNRITTVPKDRSKDRTIAIEPTMNVFLQLGVDGFIRKRLKQRWGINLDKQEINQEWARSGSLSGLMSSAATIDLSMASDTISSRLVDMLFPSQWSQYLHDLRSPFGLLPDGWLIPYHKLSSMGNGATFAIESTIFAACVFAVKKRAGISWDTFPSSVYGDDIVCPSYLTTELIHVLRMCGFSPNNDKSFYEATSPVRESCGTDWYRAHLVRPVYIDTVPTTVQDLFHMYNSLWIWSKSRGIELPGTLSYIHSWIKAQRHGRFATFFGPPSEVTNCWLFADQYPDSHPVLMQVCNHRTPSDWLFGKMLAQLKPAPPVHPWETKGPVYLGGSVFADVDPKRFHYATCTRIVHRGFREEISDTLRALDRVPGS